MGRQGQQLEQPLPIGFRPDNPTTSRRTPYRRDDRRVQRQRRREECGGGSERHAAQQCHSDSDDHGGHGHDCWCDGVPARGNEISMLGMKI